MASRCDRCGHIDIRAQPAHSEAKQGRARAPSARRVLLKGVLRNLGSALSELWSVMRPRRKEG